MQDRLNGRAIYLRFLEPGDASAVLELYRRNRAFLAPWEPERSEEFYTLRMQREMLQIVTQARHNDQSYNFGVFLKTTHELIGRVNISAIVRGVFQSANLGYLLDEAYNGRGYMTEAVKLTLKFAFQDLNLHRLQAATLTTNFGSMRVLQKAGFRPEGIALRYLKINSQWQDHNLFAITAEEFSF